MSPNGRSLFGRKGAGSTYAFAVHQANILELAAEAAPGGPEAGGAEGSALAALLLRGCACLYHLAAQAGVRASWGSSFEVYTRTNVRATQQLLEACVAAEAPKVTPLVLVALRRPGRAAAARRHGAAAALALRVTKLAGEHLCGLYHANHGLDAVSLRFFTVYGLRQRPDMAFHKFIKAMLGGREFVIYGDGTQTRDFTHVDDIVEGLVLAQQAPPGATMNPGGGNRVSLLEAVGYAGRARRHRAKADQAGRRGRRRARPLSACQLRGRTDRLRANHPLGRGACARVRVACRLPG